MNKVPRLATSLLLFNSQRILLVQRKNNPGQGLWSIPGGKVNFQESLHDACQREVLEETGVQKSDYFIQKEPLTITEYRDDAFHYVIVQYLAKLKNSNVKLQASDDALQVGWFSVDEMAKLQLVDDLDRVVKMGLLKLKDL